MSIIERARELRRINEENAETMTDAKALQCKELFSSWEIGKEYKKDKRLRYKGKLYKVKQKHTSQADWEPDVATSLYEEVPEEGQGTIDNPIPYNNNMALEEGKYYSQNGAIYHCFRNSEIAVYNNLADLVGIYVEVVI